MFVRLKGEMIIVTVSCTFKNKWYLEKWWGGADRTGSPTELKASRQETEEDRSHVTKQPCHGEGAAPGLRTCMF